MAHGGAAEPSAREHTGRPHLGSQVLHTTHTCISVCSNPQSVLNPAEDSDHATALPQHAIGQSPGPGPVTRGACPWCQCL